MFYTKKEIVDVMKYRNMEEFIEKYVSQYNNCCVMLYPGGVFFDYDHDTNYLINNEGCIIPTQHVTDSENHKLNMKPMEKVEEWFIENPFDDIKPTKLKVKI